MEKGLSLLAGSVIPLFREERTDPIKPLPSNVANGVPGES